jgi:hypothetical protein
MNTLALPISRITGLRPEVWISVGAGFAREDIKSLVLSQGKGFIGESITTLQEICLQITRLNSDRILSSTARQEVLRLLLAEPRIIGMMSEMKRIRRQRNFIRRLDSALQMGRLAFAHPLEEEVYYERLKQSLGVEQSPLRQELRVLSHAYEAWCQASSYFDLPLLIRLATDQLREGWPAHLRCPQEVWSLSGEAPESLEKEFWEVLGQHLQVKRVDRLSAEWNGHPEFRWEKWHTLDDAAESFADRICEESEGFDWNQHAVLIPDVPSIRRCLRRALESRGIPLADPRDPTRLRWDESVKWAILPLEVVGRNFERQKVISWLRSHQMQEEFPSWVNEINSRGVRNGLGSYAGGMLSGVHSRLQELSQSFGGRKTCEELAESHLKLLRTAVGHHPEQQWLIPFFEQTWKVFQADFHRIGQEKRKAPLLFWLERLQARLSEASPPVDRLKPRFGVQLYRLQQSPVRPFSQVWVFGLPAHWLSGKGLGDYWFSERERDVLSLEFAIRGPVQIREERIQVLKSWMAGSGSVVFLDSYFDSSGREQESILPVLKELELSFGQNLPETPLEKGSHSRFTASYQVLRPIQPQEIQLPPLARRPGGRPPELTATTLERMSRCSFQALAYHRWNVRDVREPDGELWPDVRGTILHEAVRILLTSLNPQDEFTILPREALEQAWRLKRPKGLIRTERIERYVKARMLLVLETFCEKERDYLKRSGTHPFSLEDVSLRLDYPEFSIHGLPDRMDQYQDGLFVIDYKSSGTVPHGSDMIEQGYRLQLPFYALAAQRHFQRPVMGVQFIELDRKGSRRSGIFFKKYNGKSQGMLTQVTARSKSLVAVEPEDAWSRFEEHRTTSASSFIRGEFQARPKSTQRSRECNSCSLGDLCGLRRLVEPEEETTHG